jgi:putative protease
MGFKRVVLAREMSKKEIEKCCEIPVELEVFVHGALCMCVSGQCYLSAMIGARSGNRGSCAQPCRLPFSVNNQKGGHALSLKDNSIVNYLGELQNMGVASAKIEGRMKRPEYVSAAVSAVKKAIDGEYSSSDEFMLRSVFSRSGFTNGYLNSKLGKNMFGTRQKEDVVAANNVLKEIARNYEKETPLIPLDIFFKCRDNEKAVLIAKSDKKEVTVIGDVPEKAINKPMSEESLKERLSKFGGTQYFSKNIEINLNDGLILPASKINEMRRNAVSKLDEQEKIELQYKPFNVSLPKYNQPDKPYATASFSFAASIISSSLILPPGTKSWC